MCRRKLNMPANARLKHRIWGEQGATLTELLIATVIFGFLTMILLGVINFGSNSWRNLEGRSSAQKEIRLSLLELTKSVRNTDIRTFSCGNTTNGTKTCNWMCFKTMQAIELYKPESLALSCGPTPFPNGPCPSGANRFRWSYFVLIYAISPDNCGCSTTENTYNYVDNDNLTASSDGAKYTSILNSQQYKCPHKILIKKYLAFSDADQAPLYWPSSYKGGDNNIKGFPSHYSPERRFLKANDIKPYLTVSPVPSQVTSGETAVRDDSSDDSVKANCVRLIARNILVFAVNYYDPWGANGSTAGISPRGDTTLAAPEVQFTLKTFKIMENRKFGLGAADLNSLGAQYLSLQVDEKIIPANNNCENAP
jgi:hypothetical protein